MERIKKDFEEYLQRRIRKLIVQEQEEAPKEANTSAIVSQEPPELVLIRDAPPTLVTDLLICTVVVPFTMQRSSNYLTQIPQGINPLIISREAYPVYKIDIEPLLIKAPQPLPYQHDNQVLWNYGVKVISSWGEVEEALISNLSTGLGGLTKSGRCFLSKEVDRRRKEASWTENGPLKREVTNKEAEEFLRVIHQSDYNVILQLESLLA